MSAVVFKIACVFVVLLTCVCFALGQSTDQNFPTPITSSQLDVLIKPRDLGDSRLTTYFYAFDGAQGDIFINVVSRNFTGDIDVFTIDGLQPLAKIVFYAEAEATETGRLIYLRKPERLLLRVQGRPPGDDAATFRIRFGGSFIALAPPKKGDLPPKLPDITAKKDEAGIIVNSVGTIVGTVPKTKPGKESTDTASSKPPPTSTATRSSASSDKAVSPDKKDTSADRKETVPPAKGNPPASKPDRVGTKPADVPTLIGAKKTETPPAASSTKTNPTATKPAADVSTSTTSTTKDTADGPPKTASKPPKPVREKPPDPMANFKLVVQFKTGEVIERPMNEVQRFSVDKGVLTVVGKNGRTYLYSILDVAKITVE